MTLMNWEEIEELQDGITDTITKIQTFIELQSIKSQEISGHFTGDIRDWVMLLPIESSIML